MEMQNGSTQTFVFRGDIHSQTPNHPSSYLLLFGGSWYHQEFQVPKMEVLTYTSCMDTAYVRENPPPKHPYKVQETLHFRYLKWLVMVVIVTS